MELEITSRKKEVTATWVLLSHISGDFVPKPLIQLFGNQINIGRGLTNHVVLTSVQISRHHVSLEYRAKRWFLKESSTNGVLVNGARLPKDEWTQLQDGDIVGLIPNGILQYKMSYLASASKCLPTPGDRYFAETPMEISGTGEVENNNSDVEVLCVVENRAPHLLDDKTGYFGKPRKFKRLNLETVEVAKLKSKRACAREMEDEELLDLDEEEIQNQNIEAGQVLSEIQECNTFQGGCVHNSTAITAAETTEEFETIETVKRKYEELKKENTTQKLILDKTLKLVAEKAVDDYSMNISKLIETDFTCSICSDVFIDATVLGCGHSYCHFCISEWLKKNLECPICRSLCASKSKYIEINNFLTKLYDLMPSQIQEKRRKCLDERRVETNSVASEPPSSFGKTLTLQTMARSFSNAGTTVLVPRMRRQNNTVVVPVRYRRSRAGPGRNSLAPDNSNNSAIVPAAFPLSIINNNFQALS